MDAILYVIAALGLFSVGLIVYTALRPPCKIHANHCEFCDCESDGDEHSG